uniref:AT3G52170-like helix-turn-helix domain-containing protein n=1 Tax=Cajanus cajan TaxID=3821 RepID=A0A151T0Z8_CAJCA|nr:hypothetical protein KK1_023068 [Cajanus cajan]
MMHSVKSGWGKTFALAKHNESQGKKTRIRRSKEERKAMVESFIKKYQESNNGNFPSLNITHKEVGGSFYTVREIVRDIIQENRVLGPAKFTLEELNADHFFEQNPLGSIARDPQPLSAASSIENCSENDKLSDTNSKVISVSDGSYTEAAHQVVDNGHIIRHVLNGSQVNMINKESDEAAIPEVQVGDPTTLKQNVEQELKAATTPMAKVTAVADDLIVETFPLRSVSRTTDGIKNLGGLRDSSNSPENDIKTVELKQGVGKSELNGIEPSKNLNLLDEKFEDSHGNQILKNIPDTGLDKDENVGDMFEESSNHSTIEHFDHHGFEDHINPQARVSHQNTITYGTVKQGHMMDGAKTSTQINNISKTYKPSEEDGGLLKTDIHRVDGQHGGNSQRSSNTTVDRINLESWDGATKNSARRESNPFLAVLKVLADAFVKFWSG